MVKLTSSPIRSQGGELLKLTSNFCFVKTKIVPRFWEARRDFLGRMDGFCWKKIEARFSTGVTRFLDKVVVPCVVRFNRDTIVH